MQQVRVRFAPSPTGALHIGGIRTALYNYLFARKHGGKFILRIEDTDQTRYLPGAEDYIMEALEWSGLELDEGPGRGGDFGPYRQSERKDLYARHAQELVTRGHAYYAFDTAEELETMRQQLKQEGKHTFKYDAQIRRQMRNSLNMPNEEVQRLLDNGTSYTIRLKVPEDEIITIEDIVRGQVQFHTNELDDKIILKGDGMPTYHLANIVDDHLMKISHVIRGEEWLSSTAHHILMYRFLDWEATMPRFAHIPLILKPNAKGKLSKRDGFKLGIPVFPLSWKGETPEDSFSGFREYGFLPEAMLNFLAFLGWNPGTEQEIFSLPELIDAFSLDRIGKSGARFDFEKAKWYNQQYIMAAPNEQLATLLRPLVDPQGAQVSDSYLQKVCELLKERVHLIPEFLDQGYYFFTPVRSYDTKIVKKKWRPERQQLFDSLRSFLHSVPVYRADELETAVKEFIDKHDLKFGEVFPILRISLTGNTKGPGLFDIMALLGREKVNQRLQEAFPYFNQIVTTADKV